MRWSCLFIPTMRDNPAGAVTASHRLLLRAGYLREPEPACFHFLALARRSLRRIAAIVRRELDAAGAQEVLLATEGGTGIAQRMASAARGGLRSYKQLPQLWYQFGTRVRDDPRPGLGLLGARTRRVVDICSVAGDGRDCANPVMEAMMRVAGECGLAGRVIDSPRGAMQLVVECEAGEERVAAAGGGLSHRELARAEASPPLAADPEGDLEPQPFHTPDCKTIAEVAAFTGLPPTSQMKSLVMAARGGIVLALVRGDDALSEAKLARVLDAGDPRPATEVEIRESFGGAGAGSLGPVGVKGIRILADRALQGRRNMICGANQDDYHLRHVTPGEDFVPEFHDLRQAAVGDLTAEGEPVEMRGAIEIASMRAPTRGAIQVLDSGGRETTPAMVLATLDLDRILAAAAERCHDDAGLALPPAVAPFDVVVTPVNYNDGKLRDAADALYRECRAASLDALLDDRDERSGVKFKDADLIGVPYRITIGKKLAEGLVEVTDRRRRTTTEVPPGEAAAYAGKWKVDGD